MGSSPYKPPKLSIMPLPRFRFPLTFLVLVSLYVPLFPAQLQVRAERNDLVLAAKLSLSKHYLLNITSSLYDHRGRLIMRVKGDDFYDARGRRLGQLRGDQVLSASGRTIGRIQGDKYYTERGKHIGRRQGNRLFDSAGKLVLRWEGQRCYDARGRYLARFDQMTPELFLVWWWYFKEDLL